MKNNLLLYPHGWKNLLNVFSFCFSGPQFDNFCQSATGMVVSQYSAISRWCCLFGEKHQSSLNDFFRKSPWDAGIVYSQLCRLIVRRVKDAYIGIIDDTLSHKPYAEKMDSLGWFYDGLTKKKQKGHSIVTNGLVSAELGFVPFNTQLYKKGGKSKNDIACEMIDNLQKYRNVPLYTIDSWYSNIKVLGRIRSYDSHYITEIKSNRNVTISNKKRAVSMHAKHIREKDLTTTTIKGSKYRYFQTSAFIKSLGNVNLVFSQKYEEKKKEWGDMHYLITSLTRLKGDRVIELYLTRGGIEGFHREAKQHVGMEDYHLRKGRGIERYLLLVLLVYVLLLLLNQQTIRKTFENKTLGQTCEQLKAECHTILLQQAKNKTQEEIEQIAKNWARGT